MHLSFGRLLWLYFDPFPLFRNAGATDLFTRRANLRYNRAHAHMLLPYLLRWAAMMTLFAFGCFVFQAAMSSSQLFAVLAMFSGIGVACSFATLFLLGTCYVLLRGIPEGLE